MNKRLWLLSLAMMLAPAASPAALSPTLASSSAPSLKAGQFLWDDSDGGTDPLAIMVSIDRQHLYVYRGERLIGLSTVSTGKPGKNTPMGEFRILQKNVFHRSNLYSNAPMPYMQRLTWTGIAIHGGQLPGYPASHGCIRVPLAFAKKLFAATDMGDIVSVSDGQSGPFLRVEVDYAALPGDGRPTWTDNRGRDVQLASAAPSEGSVKSAPAPTPEAVVPEDPKPVRLALDTRALSTPDTVASAAAPADPSKPHWLVPFYNDPPSSSR
ncbi:MAG: L,D-transpeptidase family protein [Sphingobium sp.]|uniref:L,D-transpeptidase family protein n=1 Tax=Sphingobium sp. TaxID=1912891 RepID=UPI00299FBEA7|nr:L,D-transpeptidase family protein [Sphingobium sp.]MDX3909804.1 L,D-transpeptidase family protein [Sphingobium sp.]